ncbi:MAG: class I SAM-dependent methyltransferase, partial [Helicobacteraceae bacterium]|nr:class I SAM-dependent methyltransferase [Helicobacteraceae bacterium]
MTNKVYADNAAQGIIDRAVAAARDRIYDHLAAAIDLESLESVIDVGATADRDRQSANFFEKRYSYPDRVTALSDQDAAWLQEAYQGLKFVRGDGLNMPFADNSFDLAFSSAVIEHVGNRANQAAFIAECFRVAKKFVFITTPNRWYPIEFHTILPLLHWLPPRLYRAALRAIGKGFYAEESNLNLLSKSDLLSLCVPLRAIGGGGGGGTITTPLKFGLATHFLGDFRLKNCFCSTSGARA